MATYNGSVVATPVLASGYRRMRTWMGSGIASASPVTVFYRASNGPDRGTASSAAAVPAGNVIERPAR